MKIFFVGDFETNTGPGIANQMLRKGLSGKDSMMYSDAQNKFSRIFEILYKTMKSDCVCFCSSSNANIIGLKVAKLFGKKSFYIMHGYSTYENVIDNRNIDEEELNKINAFEKLMFRNVEKVFCVSKKFMEYMKEAEADYRDKFTYNYNGLDLHKIENGIKKDNLIKKDTQIVSIGGGMRRKNNLMVCQAIEKLNREKDLGLKFVVIGKPHTDKEQICAYDFVTYYDFLPHEKVIEILAESYLYIQNSTFETFGLAVIEALASNCNLLVSNSVGAIDIIETVEKSDIIFDTEDVDEIARKIEQLLMNGNINRLQSGILKQEIECNKTAELLVSKISRCIN